MLVDFCLPAKNEGLIIRSSLDKLLAYCRQAKFDFSWRIIGVINGSDDDSPAIFQEYKKRYPEEIDCFEVKEAGRGGALKKYWSLSRADIVAYMDADLAVALENIPALINPLLDNSSDLVMGSRLLPGAKRQRSLGREIVSQSYILASRLLLGGQATDYQCGFKAIRREVFNKLKPLLRNDYWFFDIELVVLARHFAYRVREIPVDWQEGRYNKRSSRVKIFRDSLISFINLMKFRRYLSELKGCRDNAATLPPASSDQLK